MKIVFAIRKHRGCGDAAILVPIAWSSEYPEMEQIFENVVLYNLFGITVSSLFEKDVPSAGYIYSGEFDIVEDDPIIRKVKRLYYFKQDVE